MSYVYLLRSLRHPGRHYVGLTKNLAGRLAYHNARKFTHTAKYAPWGTVVVIHFTNSGKARDFERYLKSGSGHAFAKRHSGECRLTWWPC